MGRSAAQMGRMCGADGANVRRRWVPSAAQMGFICAADVGICGADWTVFRRRLDVICGKVFSEPEDFSDRPFLRVEGGAERLLEVCKCSQVRPSLFGKNFLSAASSEPMTWMFEKRVLN